MSRALQRGWRGREEHGAQCRQEAVRPVWKTDHQASTLLEHSRGRPNGGHNSHFPAPLPASRCQADPRHPPPSVKAVFQSGEP